MVKTCLHQRLEAGKCIQCGRSGLCEHKTERTRCVVCKGGSICEHDCRRSRCVECGGGEICEHRTRRDRCKQCDGKEVCKAELCTTVVTHNKYQGYCVQCFVRVFPDQTLVRNMKLKEREVVQFVMQTFPNLSWRYNKRCIDACSQRTPDLLLDLGYMVLIIEIDEYQHRSYADEEERQLELSKDLGFRPIVFLRFNPDSYINHEEERIASPWKSRTNGLFSVQNEEEWNRRLNTLKTTIEHWLKEENKSTQAIHEVYLYYNGYHGNSGR